MTLKTFRPLAFGAAILALGAAGAAAAQPAPPPPSPGMMAGVHDQMDMRGPGRMDPAQRMQRHADHLRAVLQLTPAQEPALRAFMDAMRPPPGAMDRMGHDRMDMARLSTPERLDRMRERMDRHREAFDRRAAAVKRFYAQLTPPQQRAFDTLSMEMMGKRMHERMERRGMGPGGRPGMGPGEMRHGGHDDDGPHGR